MRFTRGHGMQKLAHEIYSFDEFRLDLTRGALFRGLDELKLRPKSFDVLKYLTENPGRLISKDELIKSVWQGMAVTDDSLVQCLKDIRRALGGDSQQIIKTVPRRGYIFDKEVSENGAVIYTEETSGVHLIIEESEETNGHSETIIEKPQGKVGKWSLIGVMRRHKLGTAIALVTVVMATGGAAFGLYVYSLQPPVSPFTSVSIKRLTTDGRTELAAISPDGNYIAYQTNEPGGKESLWVRQTAAVNPKQIIEPADVTYTGLTFSLDGNFIYYVRDDTLYQTPTFGGSTRKLRDKVNGKVTFSPDGKRIAFTRIGTGDGKGSSFVLANADGTGDDQILANRQPPEAFHAGASAWSPDGTTIICAGGDNPVWGNQYPVAVNVADGRQTPLTKARWNGVGGFAWVADGSGFVMSAYHNLDASSQLWHVTFPGGLATRIYNDLHGYGGASLTADSKSLVTIQTQKQLNLYAMDLSDERTVKQLTSKIDSVEGFVCVTTTRDGRIIYYSETGDTGDLWIMDADGGNQRQLTFDAPKEDGARVSPDGRSIVYGVASQGIWKIDLDGGNRKQLTTRGMFPEYSPDGNWVFYTLPRDKWTMWKVSAEGGEPVRVTDHPAVQPAVSPDGKLIAYMYFKTRPEPKLYVAPIEGGDPIKVFDVPTLHLFDIDWTPDGKSVVYNAFGNGLDKIVSQPLDGGAPQVLLAAKSEAESISSFTFSRDGKQLIYSAGTGRQDIVMFTLEK